MSGLRAVQTSGCGADFRAAPRCDETCNYLQLLHVQTNFHFYNLIRRLGGKGSAMGLGTVVCGGAREGGAQKKKLIYFLMDFIFTFSLKNQFGNILKQQAHSITHTHTHTCALA